MHAVSQPVTEDDTRVMHAVSQPVTEDDTRVMHAVSQPVTEGVLLKGVSNHRSLQGNWI